MAPSSRSRGRAGKGRDASSKSSIPSSTSSSAAAAAFKDNLCLSPLNEIRPTVPSTIENFASRLYGTNSDQTRARCEIEAKHLLNSLGHLALSSCILDSFRKDALRLEMESEVKRRKMTSSKVQRLKSEKLQDSEGIPLLCNKLVKSMSVSQLDKEFATHNESGKSIGVSKPPSVPKPYTSGEAHYRLHQMPGFSKQTRQYASQARRSFLALATTMVEPLSYASMTRPTTAITSREELKRENDMRIRLKSLDFILESLDTNELGVDEAEVASIFLLIGRIKDVLTTYHHSFFMEFNSVLKKRASSASSARKERISSAASATISSNTNGATTSISDQTNSAEAPPSSTQHNETEISIEEISSDLATLVPPIYDLFTEKILLVKLKRSDLLEYAQELKNYTVPSDVLYMMNQMQRLLNAFGCIRTNNPYIAHLITSMIESIENIVSPKPESEERMAGTVAISVLGRVMKMAPAKKLSEYFNSFSDILMDLSQRKEWHIGQKFIKLIATAAGKQFEACEMFVKVLVSVIKLRWEWLYQGIQCLGVIAVSGETSTIRKIALERGLLRFVGYDSENDSSINNPESNSWRIRCASLIALTNVYKESKGTSVSLVSLEAISHQIINEKDMRVVASIYSFNNNHTHIEPSDETVQTLDRKTLYRVLLSDETSQSRIFYFFKYVSTALAESYLESQNKYKVLRKYLKSAERNGNKRQNQFRQKFNEDWEKMKDLLKAYEETSLPSTKHKDRKPAGTYNREPKMELSDIKRSAVKVPMTLSYHKNYEIAKLFEDRQNIEYEAAVQQFRQREAAAAAAALDAGRQQQAIKFDGSSRPRSDEDDYDDFFEERDVFKSDDEDEEEARMTAATRRIKEPLKISLLASSHYNVPTPKLTENSKERPSSVKNPARGTLNRRKLMGNSVGETSASHSAALVSSNTTTNAISTVSTSPGVATVSSSGIALVRNSNVTKNSRHHEMPQSSRRSGMHADQLKPELNIVGTSTAETNNVHKGK